MAVKCKINMTHKILPEAGSVKGPEGKTTGTCPDCETPGVMLSVVGGYIRAHTVAVTEIPANNPQAPTLVSRARSHPHGSDKVSTGLSEPLVDLTDTGVRTGDPRAAEDRRRIELEGAAGKGTVQLPRKVEGPVSPKTGKARMTTKMVHVEASETNVRAALEYWRTKVIRAPKEGASPAAMDGFRARGVRQTAMVSELARRLEAMMAAQELRYNTATRTMDVVHVADRGQHAMIDNAQAHRGPTLVPGRTEIARLRDPNLPYTQGTDLRRDGTVRKTTSLDLPRGRDRFDPMITRVPVPKPRLTASQRRAGRRKAQTARLYTIAQAARAAG